MQDAYLQKQVKELTEHLVSFLNKPHDAEIYNFLLKNVKNLSQGISKKDDLLIDTLMYGILCQADFIQNISSFRPSTADLTWFQKKIETNVTLLAEMGDALASQNTLSFNELAVHLISSNIELEQFQLNLILRNKRTLLNNLDNGLFFYNTVSLIHETASHYQSLEEPLIQMLTYALFQVKNGKLTPENVLALWDLLILLTNPLASMDEKTHAFEEAQKIAAEWQTSLKAAWLEPSWYRAEMMAAEIREAHRITDNLSQQINLSAAEALLSDAFLLFNTFKRSYAPQDSNFIALASFARACFLARNLGFTLPPSQHKEVLHTVATMGKGLILFLENRVGTAEEMEKVQNIRTASALMRENYHTLIALTESLAKSKSA